MQKITSAYANKLIKSLEEEKSLWLAKERESSSYIVGLNEEPVIPDYDYAEVSEKITELDEKIVTIKHALNLFNAQAKVPVGDVEMSIDIILIKMAQLNRRKAVLDDMRKQLPKVRFTTGYYNRNSNPEYKYINYDLELVKKDFDEISKNITDMQIALDHYNQTVFFDVDI